MAVTQQSGTVLLLGANGKLGRMVRAAWPDKRVILRPVTRSRTGQCGLCWSPGDPVPQIGDVVAVVALWGVTPGPGRDLSDNTRLARSAMDLGEALGAGTVLHCSSAAVYRPGIDALAESLLAEPPSDYGRAKLDMETAILSQAQTLAARQVILRIGNVAGADSLFANMRPGETITLDRFAGGHGPERSYIAPADLARVIAAFVAHEGAEGLYNVAAPLPTPMADLAAACGADVVWRTAPARAAQRVWLDTDRLSSIIRMKAACGGATYLVEAARDGGVWPSS